MRDMPEAEARAILGQELICRDAPAWSVHRNQPGTFKTECGLVDATGARAGLHVQLLLHVGLKTQLRTFKFTLFRMSLGSPERVYQLHIRQAPKAPGNLHDRPHEHIGNLRRIGDAAWLRWGYAQAIDKFRMTTGIQFVPPVTDPEIFELRP